MQNIRSKIFLFVAVLFLLCGLVSCNKSGDDSSNDLKISFGNNNYEVFEGEQISLMPVIENGAIDSSKLLWEVADPQVATCTDGIVTGVNKGKTIITVTYSEDPSVKCIVSVKVIEKKSFPLVTISAINDKMELGEVQPILITLEGTNFDTVVSYRSVDSTVVTVDQLGIITAVGEGSTVVSVKVAEKGNESNFEEYHYLIKVVKQLYHITYELNGGTNHKDNPFRYYVDECPVVLNEPTRDGYEFKGWYRDAGFTAGNEIVKISELENSDITLYAKWEVIEYQISFDINQSYALHFVADYYGKFHAAGGEITVARDASDIISNWWSYILLNKTSNPNEYEVVGAGYMIDTINVSYDLGIFYHGNYKTFSNEHLATYEKIDAFKFDPSSIGKKLYLYDIPEDYSYDANIKVSSYPSSGDSLPNQTYTVNDIVYELPTVGATYHNFLGWTLNGEYVTSIPRGNTGDLELVANWEAVEYTIDYELNGGTNNDSNPNMYTVETCPIELGEPSKVGYNFIGWYTDPNFNESTKVDVLETPILGNVKLYAKWEIIEYTITYNLDGGSMTTAYASREEVVADFLDDYNANRGTSHTAESFAALGSWDEISSASVFMYKYIDKWGWLVDYIATVASSANKHAYSVFINYTSQYGFAAENSNNIYAFAYELRGFVGGIKYSKNSGFVTADYSQDSIGNGFWDYIPEYKYTVETEEFKLAPAYRQGYKFLGWYNTSGKLINSVPKGSTGNIDVTARWELIDYTITYNLDGGSMTTAYASREEVVADFLKDYNEQRGKSHTAESFSSLGSWSEISDASIFLYNNMDKWGWLVDYIATVASSANKHAYSVFRNYTSQSGFNGENSNNIYAFAYELRGFIGGIKYSKNSGFVTADYSQDSIGNGFWDYVPVTKYNVEGNDINLVTPTKEDYEFLGWYESADFSGSPITSIDASDGGNYCLYAKWRYLYHDVDYELNGGEFVTIDISAATPVKTATLTRYLNFNGNGYEASLHNTQRVWWYHIALVETAQPGIYKIVQITNTNKVSEDYDLLIVWHSSLVDTVTKSALNSIYNNSASYIGDYVQFENVPTASSTNANIIAKFYDADDEKIVVNMAPEYAYKEGVGLSSLATPVKDNSSFGGWYNNPEFNGEPVTSISNAETSDIQLYAKWNSVEYTITYNLDGGHWVYENNGLYEIVAYSYGKEFALLVADFITDFNAHSGKSASLSGSDFFTRSYMVDGSSSGYNFLVSAEYGAKWSWLLDLINEYRVARGKAALSASDGQAEARGELHNFLNACAAGENGGNDAYGSDYTGINTSDKLWSKLISEVKGINKYSEDTPTFELPKPQKTNYKFLGWYDENNQLVEKIEKGSTGNYSLTAKWGDDSAKAITYELDGGTLPADAPLSFVVGTGVNVLPTPTKFKYNFVGWYSDASLTNRVAAIPATETNDVVLYAEWEAMAPELVVYTVDAANANNIDTYATFTEAYNAAEDYNTIKLVAGSYSLSGLTISKNIRIIGPNAGISGSGTRSAEAVVEAITVYVSAPYFELDGLQLKATSYSSGNGLYPTTNAADIVVKNCVVEKFNSFIRVEQTMKAGKISILNNTFSNVGQFFIWIKTNVGSNIKGVDFIGNFIHTYGQVVAYNGMLRMQTTDNANFVMNVINNHFVGEPVNSTQYVFASLSGTVNIKYNIFENASRMIHSNNTTAPVTADKNLFLDANGNVLTSVPSAFSATTLTNKGICLSLNELKEAYSAYLNLTI